jgi:hypothetical protein
MTGLLVSVGQGVHVGVVDERVVAVTPRELLQNHRKKELSLSAWTRYKVIFGLGSVRKTAKGAHNCVSALKLSVPDPPRSNGF